MRNLFYVLCYSTIALQSCSFGIGAAGIWGGSYVDPVGVQVSIEPKLVEVNRNSSFTAGLGFSLQGGGYREEETGFSGDLQLGYINLPLIYTYTSNKGLYGEIGLQPAYNIIAKDKYGGESYDFKDGVNDFDLGVPVGVGYQFKNGLCIGVRGTFGLLKMEKGSDESTHNYIIAGMVKYQFDWKKWFKRK